MNNGYIEKIKDYFYKFKSSKMFIPVLIIGGLILVFLILLFLSSSTDFTSNLTSIETNLSDKIYVDETNAFNTEVFGTGNLQNTVFTYKVSPTGIVYLANESLMGSKVTNQLLGLKTGEITINIVAKLGTKKLTISQKKVAVCKKLSAENLNFEEFDAIIGKSNKFPIDLGKPSICSQNITYEIANTSNATVDANGNITGIKKGTTTLIIKQDSYIVRIPINIVNESEKVTGVKFSKYNYDISVGQNYNLSAIVIPMTALNKGLIWVSSDSNIVRVDGGGTITGIKAGNAKIIVKTVSGGYTASASITVK